MHDLPLYFYSCLDCLKASTKVHLSIVFAKAQNTQINIEYKKMKYSFMNTVILSLMGLLLIAKEI